MKSTKTQMAYETYKEVCKALGKESLGPGLYLYGNWHWVTKSQRAYLLKDMSTSHLENTIEALKERHPDERRDLLKQELERRRIEAIPKPDGFKYWTVYVGGTEVTDFLVSRNTAEKIAKAFEDDGYDDVYVYSAKARIGVHRLLVDSKIENQESPKKRVEDLPCPHEEQLFYGKAIRINKLNRILQVMCSSCEAYGTVYEQREKHSGNDDWYRVREIWHDKYDYVAKPPEPRYYIKCNQGSPLSSWDKPYTASQLAHKFKGYADNEWSCPPELEAFTLDFIQEMWDVTLEEMERDNDC